MFSSRTVLALVALVATFQAATGQGQWHDGRELRSFRQLQRPEITCQSQARNPFVARVPLVYGMLPIHCLHCMLWQTTYSGRVAVTLPSQPVRLRVTRQSRLFHLQLTTAWLCTACYLFYNHRRHILRQGRLEHPHRLLPVWLP
jgi:hypothetical protein